MPTGTLAKLSQRARRVVREAAARRGYEITRNNYTKRLGRFMGLLPIDTVLDVGANTGQYGEYLRMIGFSGRIISVEPLSVPYAALQARTSHDARWECLRAAVTDRPGTLTINISGNSVSSSPLPMLAAHSDVDVESAYVSTEEAPADTIDAIGNRFEVDPSRTFLKIDVQGYEWTALDGASETLASCPAAQLELSLLPLYEGQRLMPELVERMAGLGFELWMLEMGFWDPATSRTLQCDGTFVRKGVIS